MDLKSKKDMNRHYSALLQEHKSTIEALAYKTVEQQDKRFALLADVEPIGRDCSVLDVGCGLGHLCNFLRKRGWKGKYTGIDINSDMVGAAQERLPQDTFKCIDILEEPFGDKYDYVFCVAAIQHKPKYTDGYVYMKQMVSRMFSLTRRAMAFDIFSSRVDYRDDDKLYVEPTELFNFCYTLTPRLTLRNDCRPFELMMYLYKEVSKDPLNIFKHWVCPEPRIV